MANKKIWLGILVMTLIFGMTVIGCDNGLTNGDGNNNGGNNTGGDNTGGNNTGGDNTGDNGYIVDTLNGTWVNNNSAYGEELWFDNQNYEFTRNTFREKGTYAVSGNILTLKPTHIWGEAWNIGPYWVSKNEADENYSGNYDEWGGYYSITNNTLIFAGETYINRNGNSGNNTGSGNTSDIIEYDLDPVSRPNATALSSSSVRITWNEVSEAYYYDVSWYRYEGDTYIDGGEYTTTELTYTVTGLSANTQWIFSVRPYSQDKMHSSDTTYPISCTTLKGDNGNETTKPGNVASGNVTVQSTTSLKLTWGTVSGATGYNIYRAIMSDIRPATPTHIISNGSTNTYIDTGLTTGTGYFYWITAVNSAGESNNSRFIGSGMPNTPSTTTLNAPTGVKTTVLSSSSIRVSWNSVSGATGYRVYYGPSGNSDLVLYHSVSAGTTYRDFSYLYSGSIYYYKVSAVNSSGEGPASSLVYGIPTSAPSGYGSIKINNNSSSFRITLVQISGTEGFIVNEASTIPSGDSTTYNNIPAGKTYTVHVMDNYLDSYYKSVTFSAGQTAILSYDGYSLQ